MKLNLNTGIIGHKIFCIYSTSSTNNIARNLAEEGQLEGTAVLAEEQTGGRGRNQKSWFSPQGSGIYLSIILKPVIPQEKVGLITLIAGLAIAEAMEKVSDVRVDIKWPNDLIINGRKVGGILTEAFFDSENLKYIILGIGINVTGSDTEFPLELRGKATTLEIEAGKQLDKKTLLIQLLENLEDEYRNFCLSYSLDLKKIKEKMAFMWGREGLFFEHDKVVHKGTIIDLNGDGSLILQSNGKTISIYHGELSLQIQ